MAQSVHDAFQAGVAGFRGLGGCHHVRHGSLLAGAEGVPEGFDVRVGVDGLEQGGWRVDEAGILDAEGDRDVVTGGVPARPQHAFRKHEVPAAAGRLPGAGEGDIAEEATCAEAGLAVEGKLRGEVVREEDHGVAHGAEIVVDDGAFEGIGKALARRGSHGWSRCLGR